jgi:hypothetical protein
MTDNDNPRDGDAEQRWIEITFTDPEQARDVFHTLERMLEGTTGFEAVLLRNSPDARVTALREARRTSQELYISVMEQKTEIERHRQALADKERETIERCAQIADRDAEEGRSDLDDPELEGKAGVRILAAERIACLIRASR